MKNQVLRVNSVEFKMMSETHLKILAMQGIEIVFNDLVEATSNKVAYSKPATATTVATAKPTANTVSKSSSKGKDNSKAKSTTTDKKKASNKTTTKLAGLGMNIKADDFVKIMNIKTNKVSLIGKVEKVIKDEVDNTQSIVVLTNGKKCALNYAISISEKEFKQLKAKNKKLAKASDPKEKKSVLSALAYLTFNARYLLDLEKISHDEYVAAIKGGHDALSKLYHKFADNDKIKISREKALEDLAKSVAIANGSNANA